MWGVSDDETNDPYAAPPPEEDDGEVIESVLDHRRKDTSTGMFYINDQPYFIILMQHTQS